MTQPDIERAVARVKEGALDDYATVIAAYHGPLRATFAPYCSPGIDLDEIAHLTFVEAYRQLARYTPGTNFFAWLCAIARHRLMTESERLRRTARNEENYLQHTILHRLLARLNDDADPSDTRFRSLEECLEALRPETRDIVAQRYAHRRPVQEIAATLGRTASAVSVQLFATRRKLRDCIEHKLRLTSAASELA